MRDRLEEAKSIINKKKTIEQELYDMFTKKQFCTLLDIPENNTIGIGKTKLAKALVLKWKVEKNE